jgi:hypothetical protein
MKQIIFPNREIWFGVHPEVGAFMYDKSSQVGLSEKKIKLFKLEEQKTSIFIKDILKSNLIKIDNDTLDKYKVLIDAFIKELTNRVVTKRITHCWQCKEDLDSMNFEICSKCKGIRCECNACFCNWVAN